MTLNYTIRLANGSELRIPGGSRLTCNGDFLVVDNGDRNTPIAIFRLSDVVYAVPGRGHKPGGAPNHWPAVEGPLPAPS